MVNQTELQTIDFSLLIEAKKANPNGDPLNGNAPRQDIDGHGEISDVAIRRKVRNVLHHAGESIFVQSDALSNDGYTSLEQRFKALEGLPKDIKKPEELERVKGLLTDKYIDIRLFGQVAAFNKISVALRGPVTITHAESIGPVTVTRQQITKSVNGVHKKDGGLASDRMGEKQRVEYGLYRLNGRVNVIWGEKTGLTTADVELLKQALISLFENDESAARPAGSMSVLNVYWWEHGTRLPQSSARKSYDTLKVTLKENIYNPSRLEDFDIIVDTPEDFKPKLTIYEGL